MMQHEDNVLIDQVLKGYSQAFGRLVEKYESFVYTIVLRVLHNRNDAEDASMEVFVKAYQGLGRFNRKADFSTWLYRIAYNTAVSEFRKRSKRKMEISDDALLMKISAIEGNDVVEETNSDEQRLVQALKSLSPQENTLLILYYTNNMSVDQIAAVVGISASNVKVRLFRTRKKLEELMRKAELTEQSNYI
jgi:RNA polymerase sigma-70 factor (ECF subfamily)